MKFDLSKITTKLNDGDRPPFEKFYILIFILFLAFLVGDLGALFVRGYMLPTTVPPRKIVRNQRLNRQNYRFTEVLRNNIFNADHVVPKSIGEIEGGTGPDDGDPVLSNLPITLVGTIVHANPNRSITTVMMRGQNKVEAYKVEENIGRVAVLKEILREKIIFRNKNTRKLEYIEMPKEQNIVISTARNSAPKAEAKTNFSLTRAEVDKHLENLPSLLQQARAVPDIGPDGAVKCYRLVEIKAGSLYEKIGLQKNDCILRVNSEDVTSPQKAMEMYQQLKNGNSVIITVDRGGSEIDINYTIQ